MIETTYHGKLVAKKEGIYTLYVFQLDNGEYIMCTKLPNWGVYIIEKNDSGYITVDYVTAGENYFDRNTQSTKMYQFTQCYFKDFIKDKQELEDIIL